MLKDHVEGMEQVFDEVFHGNFTQSRRVRAHQKGSKLSGKKNASTKPEIPDSMPTNLDDNLFSNGYDLKVNYQNQQDLLLHDQLNGFLNEPGAHP